MVQKFTKMKDEYIIINKSVLEKRIERLEKQKDEYIFNPNRTDDQYRYNSIIKVLREVISQSTPLIPEIEKAFDVGSLKTEQCFNIYNGFVSGTIYKDKETYISNLKLDI